jgi:hypothetical protein
MTRSDQATTRSLDVLTIPPRGRESVCRILAVDAALDTGT